MYKTFINMIFKIKIFVAATAAKDNGDDDIDDPTLV